MRGTPARRLPSLAAFTRATLVGGALALAGMAAQCSGTDPAVQPPLYRLVLVDTLGLPSPLCVPGQVCDVRVAYGSLRFDNDSELQYIEVQREAPSGTDSVIQDRRRYRMSGGAVLIEHAMAAGLPDTDTGFVVSSQIVLQAWRPTGRHEFVYQHDATTPILAARRRAP